MIFDYTTGQFIQSYHNDRLSIRGLALMINPEPPSIARLGLAEPLAEDDPSVTRFVKEVDFIFVDGVLKLYGDGEHLTDLRHLLFIMSDSEGRISEYSSTSTKTHQIDSNHKIVLQKALDKIAVANGVVLPENINFFNDKLLLYAYPLLRGLANSSTNFYKILNELKSSADREREYNLPYELLIQPNITEAIRVYLGTSSKNINKYVFERIIIKTDLVKSLSPKLLDILVKHSGKIFGAIGQEKPEVKVLTCYEDIELNLFTKLRFLFDVFDNNIDHVQKFLTNEVDLLKMPADKLKAAFLKKYMTPKKIFRILEDENANSYLNDVINQCKTYAHPDSIPYKLKTMYPNGLEIPKNWKNLKELHDKVSADYNKIKAEDNNKTIPYNEVEWQLHGLKKDNVEFMLPSEASTLVAWGSEQRHCVASFADKAARKDCIILGVKINGKHLYTLELTTHEYIKPIKPSVGKTATSHKIEVEGVQEQVDIKKEYSYEIRQFHGYSNRSPETLGDKDLKKTVNEMLRTVFTAPNYSYSSAGLVEGRIDNLQDALAYAVEAAPAMAQGEN